MKASFDQYKPKDFKPPKGVIRVEICRTSGGLACEKCIENGVRSTYYEIATEEQAPRDPCPTHSGYVPPVAAVPNPANGGAVRPRVKEVEGLTPIPINQPVVLGKDPYGSDEAVARMLQIANVGNVQAPLSTTQDVPSPEPKGQNTTVAPAPVPTVVPPTPKSDVILDRPEPLKFD
jgi:hypothetical protein